MLWIARETSVWATDRPDAVRSVARLAAEVEDLNLRNAIYEDGTGSLYASFKRSSVRLEHLETKAGELAMTAAQDDRTPECRNTAVPFLKSLRVSSGEG
jgi:hypothetical protein